MAALATARTREALWEAMWSRRTVATTGPRIILDYELAGNPMGSELSVAAVPGLSRARRVAIRFHGTAPAARIDVIRNNKVVRSFPEQGLDAELTWTDENPIEEVLLPPARLRPDPFCFYYVRAVQTDGEVAWTSPTWIDG
jgi:hypothetical protein